MFAAKMKHNEAFSPFYIAVCAFMSPVNVARARRDQWKENSIGRDETS
jgi:hypothetical protein